MKKEFLDINDIKIDDINIDKMLEIMKVKGSIEEVESRLK
jgi:hypothetical protein